jgi:hypothetical protein
VERFIDKMKSKLDELYSKHIFDLKELQMVEDFLKLLGEDFETHFVADVQDVLHHFIREKEDAIIYPNEE